MREIGNTLRFPLARGLRFLLLGIIACIPYCAISQDGSQQLNVRFVEHKEDVNDADVKLNDLFKDSLLTETGLDRIFTSVAISTSSYDSSPASFGSRTIASFSPATYVAHQSELRKMNRKLIPILITKKRGDSQPYYNSICITSSRSEIRDLKLDWARVDTVYFVNRLSTSGYVVPLRELKTKQLIDYPAPCALVAKGKVFQIQGSHGHVVQAVQSSKSSIGFVWTYEKYGQKVQSEIRELGRFGTIPQDVICISEDLAPYQQDIIDWFERSLADSSSQRFKLFERSGREITGVLPFDEDRFRSAYADLESFVLEVEQATEQNCRGWFDVAKDWKIWPILGFIATIIATSYYLWAMLRNVGNLRSKQPQKVKSAKESGKNPDRDA